MSPTKAQQRLKKLKKEKNEKTDGKREVRQLSGPERQFK